MPGTLYFLHSQNSRVNANKDPTMADNQNVKESLENKEGRLVRELKDLKRAERVRELERELAELRATQRTKELQHQLEEQKRVEEIKELERQVKEVLDRPWLNSESSCSATPTRDPNTQPSVEIGHSHDPISVESATYDSPQEAHRSVLSLLGTTRSEAA